MADYDVIDPPEAGLLRIRETEIRIRPITVGRIPAFMRAVRSISLPEGIGLDNVLDRLPELFADHGEQIIEAVSIAANVPRETVDGFDLDELLQVAGALIEVNGDFFFRSLLPRLTALTQGLRASLVDARAVSTATGAGGAGRTRSSH